VTARLALILLASGCGPGARTATLLVDVQTDYVPGIEADAVEVVIGGETRRTVMRRGEDWSAGERVAQVPDLPEGDLVFDVRLLRAESVVTSRRVRLEITAPETPIVVPLQRACRDVSCDALEACVGGRCVADTCLGSEPSCGAPECVGDVDCGSAPCGSPFCDGGLCFVRSVDACELGAYCAAEGCAPEEPTLRLRFTADPELAARAARLELEIDDARTELEVDGFPLTVTRAADVREVIASLRDAEGLRLGMVRGTLDPGLEAVSFHFDALCEGIVCGAETCVGGYCVDACHRDENGPRECAAPCTLMDSGPVVVSADGEVVENLRIDAVGEPAIVVDGFRDVVLRNLELTHDGAPAIAAASADGLRVESVSIRHDDSADRAPGIEVRNSDDVGIARLRVAGSAGAIVAFRVTGLDVRWVHAEELEDDSTDELVDADFCEQVTLRDFSSVNSLPSGSRLTFGDVVDLQVTRGLLDGSNRESQSALKVSPGTRVRVSEVDVARSAHVAFEAFPGDDVEFLRTRCRDVLATYADGTDSAQHCWYATGDDTRVLESAHDGSDGGRSTGGPGVTEYDVEVLPGLAIRDPLPVGLCFD